jgi:hypothetical protein
MGRGTGFCGAMEKVCTKPQSRSVRDRGVGETKCLSYRTSLST